MPRALRTVLVDIDGTLIDSNDAHTRAWLEVLARHARERSYDAIRPLIGMGGDKLLAAALGPSADAIDANTLDNERGALFLSRELHQVKPTRGARELLEKLHAAGLQVVVATSAKAKETDALLRQASLDDLIDRAADSDDVDGSKPDPDIIQAALRKSGTPPSEAVMLGDTPYDIEAARKAGVATIVLRCGGWWNDDAFTGAVAIYDDPADLIQAFDDSPLNPVAST